jgi:Skp family chaperone for outer membrane proteins
MKKIIIPIIAVLIIAGLFFGGKYIYERYKSPASQVASIKQETLFELKEFKDVQKKLEEDNIKAQQYFAQNSQNLNEKQKEMLYFQIQQELEKKRAELLKPVYDKISLAISNVAFDGKYTVVVDSKVIAFGAKDITNDVIELLKSSKELKDVKIDTQFSPIGYFDQETVRALKIFQGADQVFLKEYQTLQKEIDSKTKGKSPEEQNSIIEEYNKILADKKAEIYAPLFKKINSYVEKVSKEKNISLVLDKASVMYGGYNLTEDIINELRKDLESK